MTSKETRNKSTTLNTETTMSKAFSSSRGQRAHPRAIFNTRKILGIKLKVRILFSDYPGNVWLMYKILIPVRPMIKTSINMRKTPDKVMEW